MSWGRWRWRRAKWGTRVFRNALSASLDFACSDVATKTVEADLVAMATDSKTVSADFLCQGTVEKSVGVDMFVSSLPDEFIRTELETILLAEIQFRDGTKRVAPTSVVFAGFAWDGVLSGPSEILRALDRQTDDVSLTLDDSGQHSIRYSAGFTDTYPPEGCLVIIYLAQMDDPTETLVEIFRGRVERIRQVSPPSLVLDAVRADVVDDRVLGRLVDPTTHPNAPVESVGRMLPIVYGSVTRHKGIVTNANWWTQLAEGIGATEAEIRAENVSGFPPSGTVEIDDERITYTGKTASSLTGCSRGASGTTADSHSVGAEVLEIGTFEVTFADHALSLITNVFLKDSAGNLVPPAPSPIVSPSTGKATWPATPKILVPGETREYLRASFQSAGSGNTASDPDRACRDSAGYDDRTYASIGSGQSLVLQRTAGIDEVGSITRVALVIALDTENAAGAVVAVGSQAVGTLTPGDTTPDWARKREETVSRASYSLADPTHSHSFPGTEEFVIRPSYVYEKHDWQFPESAYDGNENTQAATYTAGGLEARGAGLNLAGYTVESFYLFAVTGGPEANQVDHFQVRVAVSTSGALWSFVSLITPTTKQLVRTTSQVKPGSLLPAYGGFYDMRWYVDPQNYAAGRLYNCRDMGIIITARKNAVTPAATGVNQRRTVLNYFDVTSLVGDDWAWFSDTSRGGKITVANPPGTLRVLNCYYVIEVRPWRRTASYVPDVFADVTGIVPTGKPTDVLQDIITRAQPLGMGLGIDAVAKGTYLQADAGLVSDGMRLDFATTEQVSAVRLLADACEQADLRGFWANGQHGISRKPNLSALLSAILTITKEDVIEGTMKLSRTAISAVSGRVEGSYLWDASRSEMTAVSAAENATSLAFFGRRVRPIELALVRNATAAGVVVSRDVARRALPRWVAVFETAVSALDLRRGDIIAIDHPQASFAKAEVLSVSILPGSHAKRRLTTLRIEAIVWEE